MRACRGGFILAGRAQQLSGTDAQFNQRPLLRETRAGLLQLEEALDAERRRLIRANESRLAQYREASLRWVTAWSAVEKQIVGLALGPAHEIVVARALEFLPFQP